MLTPDTKYDTDNAWVPWHRRYNEYFYNIKGLKMLRYLACAATAFMFLSPAQAALQSYDWSFTGGFSYPGLDGFPRDTTLKGTFTVDDLNADGKFDKSELQSLSYFGHEYTNCAECTIDSFLWVPGSAPKFDLSRSNYTGPYYYSHSLQTGVKFRDFGGVYGQGEPYSSGGDWTPDVTWKVSAVPEPQTWLMLGAGLLAIGAAVRRRKVG
ncbi:PEP-CTERM sorting domain-containing protein [Massilia rubra]|uniref:PEP-CTERM sorting domain-containing protein n=1 Tax=Massilia rubra TaxID=2607910 RepID=A0ABX0LKU6_9BURK|nr:PEP-CTERM sorting domain-containing protein [Massilia rubra]NHZ35228.1 PEP-CTERM sorting domain-containing protein [Massilia rubra]